MLVSLLFLSLQSLAPGAYGMPELCKLLTQATGTTHTVEDQLRDYPVFVSVKSGDPQRIEKLVASALHAEWVQDGAKYRLKHLKVVPNEDFAEFQRLFQAAADGDKTHLALPTRDLYQMAPGEIVRYGPGPNPNVREIPKELKAPESHIIVRRLSGGAFEFSIGGRDLNFNNLPDSVKTLLGKDLAVQPFSAEDVKAVGKMMSNPASLKIDWSHIQTRDPIAVIVNLALKPIAAATTHDIVIALPDFSIFAFIGIRDGATVETALSQFSICDIWITVDGAAVAHLSDCELQHPAQAKRDVLSSFITAAGKDGVVNINSLGDYVASQRPAASETWTDAMMLVLAGLVIDQEYIGDYPFNIRLYTQFDATDWQKLRSGSTLHVADLSPAAQQDLFTLMLQSRSRLEKNGKSDPAYWRTLDPTQLTLTVKLTEKQVLIGFTTISGDVRDVELSAMNYDWQRKGMDHEPVYQPATQRKLEITVADGGDNETLTTGFSIVDPGTAKKVAWQNLPEPLLSQFKKALESIHTARHPVTQSNQPPPK